MDDDPFDFFSGIPEEQRPASSSPSSSPQPAWFVRSGDSGNILVELEADGRRVVLENNEILPRIESGAPLLLHPRGHGGFDLIDPRWLLRDPSHQLRSLTYGSSVGPFVADAVDEEGDALLGRAAGVPARLERRFIRRPQGVSTFPLKMLVGRSLKEAWILDPASRPIELCNLHQHREVMPGSRTSHPGLFLLMMEALARHNSSLPARVIDATPTSARVELYGCSFSIHANRLDWYLDGTNAMSLTRNNRIDVSVTVERSVGAILPSLLRASDSEWQEIKQRFPQGRVVRDVQRTRWFSYGIAGMVTDDTYNVQGYVPPGSRTHGNDPEAPFFDTDAETSIFGSPPQEPSFDAMVTGHDDARCALVLSHREVRPSPWKCRRLEVGQCIPIRMTSAFHIPYAKWDHGHVERIAASKNSVRAFGRCFWMSVTGKNQASNHLSLSTPMATRRGRVTVTPFGERGVTFDDGTFAAWHNQAEPADGVVEVRIVDCRFAAGDPEVTVRPAVGRLPGVEATVLRRERYGLSVDIDGKRGFLPAEEYDLSRKPPAEGHIERTLQVHVVDVGAFGQMLVSRRELHLAEIYARSPSPLVEGNVIGKAGLYKTVGVDGAAVETAIDLSPPDPTRTALAPALDDDTWAAVLLDHPIGTTVAATVVGMSDDEAFLWVEPGVIGTVPTGQIGWSTRHKKPSDLLSLDQPIDAVVQGVDSKMKRLILSHTKLLEQHVEERYPPQTTITGKIHTMFKWGVLLELEPGIVAFLLKKEIGRSEKNVESFLAGAATLGHIEATVISVNTATRRIVVSRKPQMRASWTAIVDRFPEGSTAEGTISNITDYGVFVQVTDSLDGLAHITGFDPPLELNQPSKLFEVGQKVTVTILSMDHEKQRIALGMRLPPNMTMLDEASEGSGPTDDIRIEAAAHTSPATRMVPASPASPTMRPEPPLDPHTEEDIKGFDVFLSYSSEYLSTATALYELLTAHYSVFMDKSEMLVGDRVEPKLKAALRSAPITVVLVPPTQRKLWADGELHFAIDLFKEDPSRKIIPVLLDGAEPPLPLSSIHCIGVDTDADLTQVAEQILTAVDVVLGVPAHEGLTAENVRRLRSDIRRGKLLQPDGFLCQGRYQLRDVLGLGGYATVWKAFDRESRRDVAIKILHGHLRWNKPLIKGFIHGARTMMRLQHKGYVRIHSEPIEDDGLVFFAMELMKGGDLEHAIRVGLLHKSALPRLATLVADALHHAHAQGLVHRDIKPSNILLSEFGSPHIGDLDLVRDIHDTISSQPERALGSLVYAAPEQLEDPSRADHRADIYSLAMTLTYCICQRKIPKSAIMDPLSFLRGLDLPLPVERVLERALQPNPDDRFDSVRELGDELSRSLRFPYP